MRCAACGKDNRDARKFCAECGSALLPKCPACGFANEPRDRFCGGCGKPLSGQSAASSAADVDMRPATILFVDLAGYTRLSNTSDPDDVRELLNDFFARTDKLIVEAGGTVDKHIGDCVMGVFGAPVAHDDDA